MAKRKSRRSRSYKSRGRKSYLSRRTGKRRSFKSKSVGITPAWKSRHKRARWACAGAGRKIVGFRSKRTALKRCSRPIKVR